MDEDLQRVARDRGGLVLPEEVGGTRRARRQGLVVAQPGVLVAGTQPLDAATVARAVGPSVTGEYWFAGRAALWLYGAGEAPPLIDVGVRADRQLVLGGSTRVRRLAPSLLSGVRVLDGRPVVSLETAVVQSVEDGADVLEILESVLRRRLTTIGRLRNACRRGVAGSADLRAGLHVVADGHLEHLQRRLKAALVAAGVTGLRSEVHVRSRSGSTAYLDLLHDATRNAVELDGWATHIARSRFRADRRRDRWVRSELGILTTRVAADEVREDMAAVVAELLPLLRPSRRSA